MTSVLHRVEEDGRIKEVRAHQKQLRAWKEPPVYLVDYFVYQLYKNRVQDT